MKKTIMIGLAIAFVLAAGSGVIAYAQSAGSRVPTWNGACIVGAVEKRETSIIATHDTLASAMKASLEKRKTSLIAAWGLPGAKDRRAARQAAWNAFRAEQKVARQAHLSSTKSAWQQYKTDAATCKLDVSGVEPEGLDVSVSASAASAANTQ